MWWLAGYLWVGGITLAITAHMLPRNLWWMQVLAWPIWLGVRAYRYWLEMKKIREQMERETAGMTMREAFQHTRMRAREASERERQEREELKRQGKGSWLW